ncbi:MAG: hypothetical protein ACR2P6_01940, partial [Gammaproteobacteria bacterium]
MRAQAHAAFKAIVGFLLGAAAAQAHVPYIEDKDYPEGPDFVVTNASQSKAFYAYLDSDDIDGFSIVLDEPGKIYVSTLIPFCREYAFYDVNFALIGPGLPEPSEPLPVDVPAGHGAIVHNAGFENWADRPYMYEMFSDRRYFDGRRYTHKAAEPGTYRFIIWHNSGKPGDYIAIIGRAERFGLDDMKLSYTNTPIIQRKEEMR